MYYLIKLFNEINDDQNWLWTKLPKLYNYKSMASLLYIFENAENCTQYLHSRESYIILLIFWNSAAILSHTSPRIAVVCRVAQFGGGCYLFFATVKENSPRRVYLQ